MELVEYINQYLNNQNINLFDSHKETTMFRAVRSNDKEAIELLLDKGADINFINNIGETPLWYAQNSSIAKLLLDHCADVNVKNHINIIFLNELLDLKKYDIAKILLSNEKIDVNLADGQGNTALETAFICQNQHGPNEQLTEIIKLIESKKIALNRVNNLIPTNQDTIPTNEILDAKITYFNLFSTSALTAGIIGVSDYVKGVLPNFAASSWNKASSVLSPITNMIEHSTNNITSLLNLSTQSQSAASSFVRRAVGSATPVIIAVAALRAVRTFMSDKNKHNTMTNSIADALYEGGTALAEGAAAGVTGAILTGVATSLAAGAVISTTLLIVGGFTAALAVRAAAKAAKTAFIAK